MPLGGHLEKWTRNTCIKYSNIGPARILIYVGHLEGIQCDQKARLFVQYLASFSRENLSTCIKKFKLGSKSLPSTI